MGVVKGDRSIVRKNSAGSEMVNRRLNFIEGSNVTLTIASDPTDNEVDITIDSTGGGGGGNGTIAGSGVVNKFPFFATASTLSAATGVTYDPDNMRLGIGLDSPLHQFHLLPQTIGIPFVLGSAVSANGAVSWLGNDDNQFFGLFDAGNNRGYGISRYLPAPQGTIATSTIGGYYAGLGIGGGTNQGQGQPIFGVLAKDQSSNGPGSTAFTVYDTNRVADYHGFYNDSTGKMGLGITDSGILSERLNINGRIMMSFMTGVSNVSGFGKLYTKPDSELYWLKADGTEYAVTPPSAGGAGSVGGSGVLNKFTYWANASMLSSASGLSVDPTNGFVGVFDTPNERLTLGKGSRFAMGFATGLSSASGYGKLYYNPTDSLFHMITASGGDYAWDIGNGTVGGSGVANKISYWANASMLSTATGLTWDDTNRRLGINSPTPGFSFETAGADSAANGAVAAWALKNTAAGGGNWYFRTGATGTNTPAGGFSFSNDTNYWVMLDSAGKMGLGAFHNTPPEQLSIYGRTAWGLTTGASNASGYGKAYVKPDGNLYFLNPTGTEYALTPTNTNAAPTIGGVGLANKIAFFGNLSVLSGASALHYDATNGRLGIYTSTPTASLTNLSTTFLGGRTTAAQLDRGYLSTATSGATWSVDFSQGSIHKTVISAATVTVWLQNPFQGGEYTLITRQDATGGRNILWPATVIWAGGTTPTPSSSATIVDMYKMIYDATDGIYRAVPTLNFAK